MQVATFRGSNSFASIPFSLISLIAASMRVLSDEYM